MGTSAFDPIVLADVRSVKNKINIAGITTGNPFSVGDVVRYDALSDKYLLARADTPENSMILGVIETLNNNEMTIVYSGEISLPDSIFSVAGATTAQVFYLSDTQAGKLTISPPSNQGSIIKPVMVVSGTLYDSSPSPLGTIDGVVINTIGTQITGDSTVDLSDVQPVGSVSAFAGSTANIPAGWELCDGGFLSTTTYSDLFSALKSGSLYGFVQSPVSLTKNSGSNPASIVNSTFFISSPSSSFRCTILSGTLETNGNISNADVLVEPVTVDNTFHNLQITNGNATTIQNATYTVSSAGSKTQFRKPDMRSRFVVGDSKTIGGAENTTFNPYDLGIYGGAEEHTLTIDQLPAHKHNLSLTSVISGQVQTTFNLSTTESGSHFHLIAGDSDVFLGDPDLTQASVIAQQAFSDGAQRSYRLKQSPVGILPTLGKSSQEGLHTHGVVGTISVNTNTLNPTVSGTMTDVGANLPHNNVPQHVVMLWIIKVRKDSYAKLLKLGPSSGGAVLAKNTAKKWARMTTPGAGATVDISYGAWGVQRIGSGNYVFTHNYFNDVGGITTEASKYIVEATVTKQSSTNAFGPVLVANPYGTTGGYTFGVRIFDVIGATNSDSFDFLNIVMYGGGTAI